MDDALEICRAFAMLSGAYADDRDNELAEAVERLLFDLEIARAESTHYRELLIQWGITAKRRTVKRLENGGFEAGWSE